MANNSGGTLPALDIETGINHSPHVVLLGAGASLACCPQGDKNGVRLPVMSNFADVVGLSQLLGDAGVPDGANFEDAYSDLFDRGEAKLLGEIDRRVRDYFSGIELPENVTLYDRILLSLRPKDAVVTFNWDPLLPQAFKRWRSLGAVLPELIFLHGNVDVGVDFDRRTHGFLSDNSEANQKLTPTPLLYPVKKKDYAADKFLENQWSKATWFLERAYYVTVYGYSAPRTDVEARELLLEAWRRNTTRSLAEIDIVDIRPKDEVEKNWAEFIYRTHGGASDDFSHNILTRHPRRTCEAFAFATLQQAPWHEDGYPTDMTLDEMAAWVQPLLAEEVSGRLSGKPHH